MENFRILVLGKNLEILETLERIIKNNGWEVILSDNSENIIDLIEQNSINLILLSSGNDIDLENSIKNNAYIKSKNIKVLEHFGGGSGLLKCEIYQLFPDLVPCD